MEQGTYHFVGVGGIGMSAIARILIARGESVSGSDVKSTPLIEQLQAEGARVTIGHDAGNIAGAHTVVVSSAIDRGNPEYVAAQRAGTPILHRGEMLARVMHGRRGIAVCGTHGKTTTTAMTHAALRLCGIDASLVLGGIDGLLETNAHDGTSPWFVTEADESDGSFALLAPSMAIVTNIENDHLNSDDELPALVRAFDAFLEKLPDDGVAIVGVDNPLSASLGGNARRAKTVTYGIARTADLRAENLFFDGLGASFDAVAGDDHLGAVELRVPGAINVQNALAAIAVARELDIPFVRIAAALARISRRAPPLRYSRAQRTAGGRRRLRASSDRGPCDDRRRPPISSGADRRRLSAAPLFAHRASWRATSPTRCAARIASISRRSTRRPSPPYPGVSERSIGEPLAAAGGSVEYVVRVEDLADRVFDEAPHGAMILMLGAGNITDVAARLAGKRMSATTAQALRSSIEDRDRETLRGTFGERVQFDAPIAPHTSWKIGGPADALVLAENEPELAALMRFCFKRKMPWFVIGGGSNVLVGDGGMRGVVVRLGGGFAAIDVRAESEFVIVDAGASAGMAAVTARAASAGAEGIGSLSGIPGTVGGSLRMNAGTDREIGDFVRDVWVQSPAKPEPHAVTVQYFYRHSTLARDAIVSRVTLAFRRAEPAGCAGK